MARVVYGDLFLNFTPGASTTPTTTTAIGSVITNHYIEAYGYYYGAGSYSADDSTDTDTVITSEEFKAALKSVISDIINKWSRSVNIRAESREPLPSFSLSKELKALLDSFRNEESSQPLIDSIRTMGNVLFDDN
jgi:hypothetical protein